MIRIGWFDGVLIPLSTIFQFYIVAVSFIGGRNHRTRRKPM